MPLGRAASRPPGAHASSWARPVRRRVTQRGAGASCSQAASPLLWACGPGSLAARRPRSRARPHERQELRNELKNIEVTVSSDYSPDLAEALARGRLDLAFMRVEPGYDLGYHVTDLMVAVLEEEPTRAAAWGDPVRASRRARGLELCHTRRPMPPTPTRRSAEARRVSRDPRRPNHVPA